MIKFILGLILGTLFGFFIMGLMVAADDGEDVDGTVNRR